MIDKKSERHEAGNLGFHLAVKLLRKAYQWSPIYRGSSWLSFKDLLAIGTYQKVLKFL